MTTKPDLIAHSVTKIDGREKAKWLEIGVAFKNQKGGYNLTLNALPVNGQIVLLPPTER